MKDLSREQHDRPDIPPASGEASTSKDLDFREIFAEKSQFSHFDKECNKWTEPIVGVLRILEDLGQYWVNIRQYKDNTICANHLIKSGMKLLPKDSKQLSFTYWSKIKQTDVKEECLQVKFENKENASQFAELFTQCCRKLNENVTIETSKDKLAESLEVNSNQEVNSKQKLLTKAKPDFERNLASFKMEFREDLNAKKSFYKSRDSDDNDDDETEIITKDNILNSQQDFQRYIPKVRSNEVHTNITGFQKKKTYDGSNNTNVISAETSFQEIADGCMVFKTVGELGKLIVGDRVIFHATDSVVALIDTVDSSEDEPEPNQGTTDIISNEPGSKPASSATSSSLSELFKPKAGSWECDGCLVRNNSDVVKCPACGTLKAGTKPEDVPKPTAGGISFGASLSAGPAGTGFKFGTPASSTSSMPTTGGFTFTAPTTTAPATGGFKFGAPATSTPPTTGFVFKNDSTAEQKPAGFPVKTTPNPTGFIFGGLTTPSGATATTPSTTTAATTSTGLFSTTPSTASGSSTSLSTPSTGFTFGPKPTGFSFASPASTAKTPSSSGLLAKLLTSDDVKAEVTTAPGSAPTAGFSFTMPSKSNTSFGSVTPSTSSTTQGFQFSFSKSPVKPQQTPVVPGSPEVDEHGMYINKEGDDSHIHFEPVVALPEKIEVKTGEEDEAILFESRGKMYRFVSGEWKEKGVGVVKILEHKDTKKTRVLMRRDQVLKICCNHKIEPALSLQPMAKSDGKAWVWYALDFSEDGDDGKMEQLALRFRNAEIANEFKKVFEQSRDNSNTNQSRTQDSEPDVSTTGDQSVQDEDDDDVIIIGEEKPTAEQITMARKFQLPDTFYLYENKPPCPGCIGCGDGELPKSVAPVYATKTSVNKKFKENLTSTKPPTQQTIFGGAGNLPDFASLTSDTPSDKKDGNSFVFGTGASLDFSSLASSNKAEEFSWKKTDSSGPFKFAGAGQKLFGVGTTSKEAGDDGEDGGTVAPSEDIHFEPVIPLPDLVEVKTGEEDWKVLFCQRAKLYKFDEGLNQWKERGIGDLKIMQHNTKNMFRILQRREQVLKVACNHLISVDMNLKPLSTSETAWCWVANDFTDTEPSVERFAAKFKTKDIAMEFSKIFTSCQEKLSTQENVQSSAYEDEEEDDEEEEDSENILFEKRATLSSYENGTLTKIGLGNVQVIYNEDLNGDSIVFKTDDGATRCSHVICLEHTISFDPRRNVCEWKPIDYSTDEPIRKHFSAAFSSPQAAEEFVNLFHAGQKLAVDSEISEKVPTDIDDPEIYSAGGN